MKKLIMFSAFAAFLVSTSFGQETIPQSAKDHFATTYPMASKVKWDVEKDKIEVEFELNGVEWEGYYDTSGNWLKTKRELKKEEVPQVVLDGLKNSEFGSWNADDPHEYQTPEHKSLYQFEVKNGTEKKVVFFTPDGQLVPEKTKNKE